MSYHEVIFPEFFQASLGVISASILAIFWNEKFIEQAKTTKSGEKYYKLSMLGAGVTMFISLANLLPIAAVQEITCVKIISIALNLITVLMCVASVGAMGLLRLKEEPEENEDKSKQLNDSANRSISSSEDSQQQVPDIPKGDSRKPQKEPNPEEGTEDSITPTQKARKTGLLKRILRASKYFPR